MTISLVMALMDGDERLPKQVQKSKKFWADFFEQHRNDSDADLAQALGDVQITFEWQVFDGDRVNGKELMPLTALASLYDEASGFDDPTFAARVANAFEASMVSLEVKSYALEAAVLFSLGDHHDELRGRIARRYQF